MYCSIESCFNFDRQESKNLFDIENSPLTECVYRYNDFDTVLDNIGDMHFNIGLIAGVCGISKQEVRRQLLEKEIICILNYFDYWQTEEVKEKYIDLYNAYEKCLLSKGTS